MADYQKLLAVAYEEAQIGLSEGGVPVGAVLADQEGNILGRGHNMRVQNDDPTIHGETAAFKNAGRQRGYRNKILVTTLSPCWYCTGLIKQFNIGELVVGESVNFKGGQDWLVEQGVKVTDLRDEKCIEMMRDFIANNPDLWAEDIGD